MSKFLQNYRQLIQDDKYNLHAFTITCDDGQAETALITVANGYLRVDLEDATSAAREIKVSLTDTDTNTVGRLFRHIRQNFSNPNRLRKPNPRVGVLVGRSSARDARRTDQHEITGARVRAAPVRPE